MKFKNKVVLFTLICFIVMATCYFSVKKNNFLVYLKFQPPTNTEEITKKMTTQKAKDDYDFSNPVPMSDAVFDSYFDDAVFFGDSLTYGMTANFPIDSDNVIACKGASIRTMMQKVELSGKEEMGTVNAIGEVVDREPKKIYIMLGINGLAWMTTQQVIDDYEELIDRIRIANPYAKIYMQSIFPVSKFKEQSDDRYNNYKIDKINNALLNLASEKQVYFLDTNSILKDEKGNLSSEFTNASDGIHINQEAYELWYEYLCEHTA